MVFYVLRILVFPYSHCKITMIEKAPIIPNQSYLGLQILCVCQTDRAYKKPGVKLVYQCPCASMEANGGRNVLGRDQFPGMELVVREFSFHQLNANLLWPGTFAFAEWLVQHRSWIEGRHVIELGSGTGALAIFLKKLLQIDITTSDYDDQEIEDNITYNCKINEVIPPLPHLKHTWGDAFSIVNPSWDLVIASDILLYVKQYPNLIKTLSFLLKAYQPKGNTRMSPQNEEDGGLRCPAFLMSWRRRIGKDDETLFFKGCEDAGLEVQHLGSRVYCITAMGRNEETENSVP